VKVFYEPDDLMRRLTKHGWIGHVRATERFFLCGCVSK
jgi:hypothetical protein